MLGSVVISLPCFYVLPEVSVVGALEGVGQGGPLLSLGAASL